MKAIDLYILSVRGMLKESNELLNQGRSDPSIDRSRYVGETYALGRVLRYLENQKLHEEHHGVSLDESLALMQKEG